MSDCSSRFSILTSLCCFSLPQPALHTQLGAVRNRVGQPHLESQHYTIPVCLLLFARQDTHPVFLFLFLSSCSPFPLFMFYKDMGLFFLLGGSGSCGI